MKVVLKLIVSSFKNLSAMSDGLHDKRTLILENVASVVSLCHVMYELKCEDEICLMFQLFLEEIREEHHKEKVLSSMETIMSRILVISEDVPTKLITLILDSVKINNEDIRPIARTLLLKVLQNCGIMLQPQIDQAIRKKEISVEDYDKIVYDIWKGK